MRLYCTVYIFKILFKASLSLFIKELFIYQKIAINNLIICSKFFAQFL